MPYYTSALVDDHSWSSSASQPATVYYSYDHDSWIYGSEFFGATDVALLNSSQQSAVDLAFAQWSQVANIRTVYTSNLAAADILVRQADLPDQVGGWSLGYHDIYDNMVINDVLLDSGYVGQPGIGSQGYMVILHELGHSLGLGHPHEGITLPSAEDTRDYTVMSYNPSAIDQSSQPASPMIYDVAALQEIYGANTNHNSGDTYYRVETTRDILFTIWDGGGTDTLDISTAYGSTVDLREGIQYVSEIGNGHYWMAFGANIEGVQATHGEDTLIGNDLNNHLYAKRGNDFLEGNGGNDRLYGGKDHDILSGDDGDDYVNGNFDNDTVYGDRGNDIVRGGKNNDNLFGGAGDDQLYGDKGKDILTGGAGRDGFYFNEVSGKDMVTDFTLQEDILYFSHVIAPTADHVLAHTTYEGNTAHIALEGSMVEVTLVGGSELGVGDVGIV